jgi:hypothetical protein
MGKLEPRAEACAKAGLAEPMEVSATALRTRRDRFIIQELPWSGAHFTRAK